MPGVVGADFWKMYELCDESVAVASSGGEATAVRESTVKGLRVRLERFRFERERRDGVD